MTAVSPTLLDGAVSRGPEPRGRIAEFLLTGGATFLLFPLCWAYRHVAGLETSEYFVSFFAFYAAWIINDPHFGVTYVLFYRDVRRRLLGDVFSPLQRARYAVAAVAVPAVLVAWSAYALATRSGAALGAQMQLMFFLVGWHYVKQGFGVLTVLSARHGTRYTPLERRVVLLHCFAGWAYAWASPADPGQRFMEKGVLYTSLAHPHGLEDVTRVAFFASAIALAVILLRKVRSERRVPPLGPLAGLLVTVWLWTLYSSIDPLMVYLIPGLHSLQYLYFVTLLTKNQARAEEGPPSFGRPAAVRLALVALSALCIGWLFFHGAPEFMDTVVAPTGAAEAEAPGGTGPTPYFAAIFAFVNIHHYFMDHVIWRRENPETRHLAA